MISLIWAMDEQRLIGANNQMPWHLPADMKWFRQHTTAKTVLMGRKTFDSIGHALPKRHNIVLSRNTSFTLADCEVVHHVDALVQRFTDSEDELMVMGGAEIYALMLPYAQRLYCTHVQATCEGDAWFPELDMAAWSLKDAQHHASDAQNQYAYSFEIYARV